jgi:hypothetical protein
MNNVRLEGYYWVQWHEGKPSIARWMDIGIGSNDWTWVDESGLDYCSLDPEKEVRVIYGPLHLHCYSRSCLRGSSASDRSTAEHHPETFKSQGCACSCSACEAAREFETQKGHDQCKST